jgi:hypothetical protein
LEQVGTGDGEPVWGERVVHGERDGRKKTHPGWSHAVASQP